MKPPLSRRLQRERVTLQDPPAENDGAGGKEGDWTDLATFAAEVLPTGGREALLAGVGAGVQGWKVTIRHREGVTSGQRLMWGEIALNIRSAADPTGARRELVIFADSGAMV